MNTLAELYAAVLPTILQLIAAALGALMIRATALASSRWGIEIEARHREALHSAIMSGITAALSKGLSGTAAISSAVNYAANSVPDALAALKPSAEVLNGLAEAKLRAAVTALPVSMAEAAGPPKAMFGG